MKIALKIIGWTLAGLVLLVCLAGAGVYFFISSDYLRAQIANHAGEMTGRKTKIGKLHIDLGWTTHVRLEDVQMSNADWGKAPHLLEAHVIDFDIRLWPLLHGDLVLPRLSVREPKVYIERNDKGDLNWSSGESPVAAGAVNQIVPAHRHQAPLIDSIEIVDGRLSYSDFQRKLDLSGSIRTAMGQAGAEPQAELSLQGKLENRPLTLHFLGGPVPLLRETEEPYPIDLEVAYGDTRLAIKGSLQDPFQFKAADVRLVLEGSDLSQIYPLLGIPGPPTPPYRITGQLQREAGVWRVLGMKWHAGDSDLSGDVAIDNRTKQSKLTANLVSDNLAFADLAPLIGTSKFKGNVSAQQQQAAVELKAKGELFPTTPMHVERLRAMDMDVRLDARKVVAPSYLPIEAINARVLVENGQATVRPLKLSLGGGTVSGELAIDAHTDLPVVRTNLQFQDVDFGTFFRSTQFFSTNQGKLQGQIAIAGTGRSVAEIMGGADGKITLAMKGATVSALMVSLAGTQIADALVLYITGDGRIPLRCEMGRLILDHGVAKFDRTILDTRLSVLHIDGQVTLGSQTMKLKVTADPKQFDLLDLHAPVVIEGKIRAPSFTIGRLIPIPTPDFGGAKDVDCDAQIKELLADTQ